MHVLDVIILGVVEGLTEFLPISSTAHLIITAELLRIPASEFLSSFIIAIQLGAILSIVVLYWRTIVWDFETMQRVVVAFVPTALIGFILYKLIKDVLFENLTIVAWALILGGIVLIVFEEWQRDRGTVIVDGPMSFGTAFCIGCAQALAVIPGISRAGATIIGGLALGVERTKIVEFSFLLAVPTMMAATGYDLLKSGGSFGEGEWHLVLLGFVVSFVAAYAAVRFFIRFVQTHSFQLFGWYRIMLGVAILGVLAFS